MKWLTIIIWSAVGLAIIALLIGNWTKISGWFKKNPTTPVPGGAPTPAPAVTAKKRDWKKVWETGIAFAKLAALLAFTAVLCIFIIGPKMFWKGDYTYVPPQVQQAPAQAGITTQAGPPVARDQKQINILAPIGTINTPIEQWSEPLNLYGRRSQMDAFADDVTKREGVLAVNADGVIHIIGPGLDPDIGKPNVLRFLSLTNFPLKISGRME